MAVIDRSDPDGSITRSNWRRVDDAMANLFLDMIKNNPGPIPVYHMCRWYKRHVKLISCADQRALDLYALAISAIGEVYPGAKLEVVPPEAIPRRPLTHAWIPMCPKEAENVLEIIKMSNPKLPTYNWKILKIKELNGSRYATIIINIEPLEHLHNSNGVVAFESGYIALNVYRKKHSLHRVWRTLPVMGTGREVTHEEHRSV